MTSEAMLGTGGDRLTAFFDYLALRLATKNLHALSRMASEFYQEKFTTFQQFIDEKEYLVLVHPVDNANAHDRKLAYEKLVAESPSSSTSSHVKDEKPLPLYYHAFFIFLASHVTTRCMSTLEDLYDEFLQGRADKLQSYVQSQGNSISIIPIQLDESTTKAAVAQRLQHSHPDLAATLEPPDPKSTCKRKRAPASAVSSATSPEEVADMVKIAQVLHKCMEKKPWEVVFNSLSCPFDADKAPRSYRRWVSFWSEHRQAVWERWFWLAEGSDDDFAERRVRQHTAHMEFRNLIGELFEELGAQIFIDLDVYTHPGYWYRTAVLDLRELWNKMGIEYCIKYVENQHLERFPSSGFTPPIGLAPKHRTYRHQELRKPSRSMWAEKAKWVDLVRSAKLNIRLELETKPFDL